MKSEKARVHTPKKEVRLSDRIFIKGHFYKDQTKYRCRIKLFDIVSKEVYAELTRSGHSIKELEEYFDTDGQNDILSKVPGMFDDGGIIPGISLSFFFQIHEANIRRIQVKGVTPKQITTLREWVLTILGGEILAELDVNRFTSAFKRCAKEMSKSNRSANAGIKKNDQNQYFNACISIFMPILQHAVLLNLVEENPIEKIERLNYRDVNTSITKRLSRPCLSNAEESELMLLIHNNWQTDDRYLAMAFSLQLAIRPQELCALSYQDVIMSESFPEMYSLRIQAQSDGRMGRTGRALYPLDSEAQYRSVPLPRELYKIIAKKREAADPADYIFAGPDEPKEEKDLQKFYLLQLYKLGAKKNSLLLTSGREVYEYHFKLMSNLIHLHARHRMRQVCGLTESEIHYISGLSQGRDTDGAHYRDWNADITQYGLYLQLNRRGYGYKDPHSEAQWAGVQICTFIVPENVERSLVVEAKFGCEVTCQINEQTEVDTRNA